MWPRGSVTAVGRCTSAKRARKPKRSGLAAGATRARGAGHRAIEEEPDPFRTCFERDLDRIQHSKPFRRLAGKCQVFIAPDDDHLRTRLTHAIEVAQVAVSIARPAGLNVALTAAAATGHDCGHGPAGHASEEALSPFLPGGYHHAVYGADVVLAPLNLCAETLDAVRNHSWNRPAPGHARGRGRGVGRPHRLRVPRLRGRGRRPASWSPADLPAEVRDVVGADRRTQLHRSSPRCSTPSPTPAGSGMRAAEADALAAFRAFNYERIYLRPESRDQAERVIELLRSLTRGSSTTRRDGRRPCAPGSDEAVAEAVRYVSGMTDRFAFRLAVERLGWDPAALPRGGVTQTGLMSTSLRPLR